jgi:hypothetical protein
MATTVQSILYKARALLDEYTDEGIIIAAGDVADIESKMVLFIDMGQKELYRTGQLYKTDEFANKPVEPVGGRFSGFNMVEFIGETQYYPDEAGNSESKSYYVEADNTHTIEIQELEAGSWSTLYTHSGVALVPFTAYKGNITPTTTGNLIRMKISGTTYFRHINRAFYPYQFVTVPDYRPWIRRTMPTDFRLLEAIVEEFPTRQYQSASQFKWEEPNVFVHNYYWEGNYSIKYKPVPVTITSATDVLEIDDITVEALAYFAASWVAPYEKASMTNPLFQKFTELKLESIIEQPSGEENIINIYGVGGSYA